ncbi:hypothetical protein [Companilactobacillus keshanensis]|uniref:Lipoprotein n=1 Tax=Companilactobacillus keshanensis TaxID=2486003 RepID=A0ABW4BYA3_9LACO|nr:hypothetical protein [Companilactobacillus keshanensis]
MKKIKYLFLVIVPLFLLLLTGCSKLSLKTTKDTYKADGLVAVVKGKATDADKVTATVSGKTKNVKLNDGNFAISVPVATRDKNVRIKATKGDKSKTEIVKVKKTRALTGYTTFAQKYNYANLTLGKQNDQLKLIANNNGILKHKTASGTKLVLNVQDNQLMGIAMNLSYKSMKSKTGMKNFATDLAMVSQLVGADGKAVLKDLSKQIKDADGGTTTMKQITSKGVNFNINLTTKDFYLYVTK